MDILLFNKTQWLILVLGSTGLLALLGYYLLFFSKLAFYKFPAQVNDEQPPVSVIIAARNEYHNLEKNLKAVLEQDYPNFEVIVVNDCSWDDSQKLLEYYQEVYPHLKICKLIEQEKYPTGKKFAITIGIKAAKNNHLLFTDADCMPASAHWIASIMQAYKPNAQIVLGFSPYQKKKGLLNLFIRYEGGLTALKYFCAALSNNAFMGVGRNLSYEKELFFKHKGFASHQHIMSGDDDLFVNEAANNYNVSIQINPDSFVYTAPKESFDAYSRQKSRHLSTGKYYKPKHKWLLGGFYAAQIIFYPALIALCFIQPFWQLPTGLIVLKTLVQTAIFYPALKKLKQQQITWFLPVLDFLYIFYLLVFGAKGLITKNQKAW